MKLKRDKNIHWFFLLAICPLLLSLNLKRSASREETVLCSQSYTTLRLTSYGLLETEISLCVKFLLLFSRITDTFIQERGLLAKRIMAKCARFIHTESLKTTLLRLIN